MNLGDFLFLASRAIRPPRSPIRANRLLQLVPGLWDGRPRPTDLAGWDDAKIRRICRAIRSDGYTHVSHGPIFEHGSHVPSWWPRFDVLDDPLRFRDVCAIAYEEGLWTVAMIGLEDAPAALEKYGQLGFVRSTVALVDAALPFLSHACLGVEGNEWGAKLAGDEVEKTDPRAFWMIHEIGAAVYEALDRRLKFGVHWNKGYWGPPGEERKWWLAARRWANWIGFQFGTSGVTEAMVRDGIERLQPIIASYGVEFVAYEYEKDDLRHSIKLGNIARGYGLGAANGCST